jgi:hypothetical protein
MSIDKSYSMENFNYNNGDNTSKMNELIKTIKNIIEVIVSCKNLRISISINAFNEDVCDLIDFIIPDENNIEYIFEKLDSIVPSGKTNIEKPLNRSREILNNIDNNVDLIHILLTDGMITNGEKEIYRLRELLSDKNFNIFIGYGKNHNSMLLKNLSETNGEYRFIDKFENTKMVYQEILNNIIFKIVNNVSIQIINGLIYDYNTNEWVDKCHINYISLCNSKTFQIQTYNINDVKIIIKGVCVKTNEDFIIMESLSDYDNSIKRDNLLNYAFRQKVQELMFEVIYDINNNKNELLDFLRYMRCNMEHNNRLTKDDLIMMEILCNDLLSIINTFDDEKYKKMYALSRHSSQGEEYNYRTDCLSNLLLLLNENDKDNIMNDIINTENPDSTTDDNRFLIGLEPPILSRQMTEIIIIEK